MKLSAWAMVLALAWVTLCAGQATTTSVVAAQDSILLQTKKRLITNQTGPPRDLISGKYEVDANGFLYIPFAGVLKAQGMTLSQLRDAIAERLTERLNRSVTSQDVQVTKISP
jgi:protein involved in polysaccharide export with SLBB domain